MKHDGKRCKAVQTAVANPKDFICSKRWPCVLLLTTGNAILSLDASRVRDILREIDTIPYPEVDPCFATSAAAHISAGHVHVASDVIHPEVVEALDTDLTMLFNSADSPFRTEGLSRTASYEQDFSAETDRSIVPWTRLDSSSEAVLGNGTSRFQYRRAMRKVRDALGQALNRSLLDMDGEIYYSHYGNGATLDMHFDEFHEELKGTKGWLVPYRRSVTWLLFMNSGWELDRDGGGLRAFALNATCDWPVGADDQNVQVGWHVTEGSGEAHASPVFLDAFFLGGDFEKALYYRRRERREYISRGFTDTLVGTKGLLDMVYPHETRSFFSPYARHNGFWPADAGTNNRTEGWQSGAFRFRCCSPCCSPSATCETRCGRLVL